jgi:hypothetical protein
MSEIPHVNIEKQEGVLPYRDTIEPGHDIEKSPSSEEDRLSDSSHPKSDLLAREDVDPVLNAKMHLVNNVSTKLYSPTSLLE